MKRVALASCLLLACQLAAEAGPIKVGDRVIFLGRDPGRVTELGGPSGQVRVMLDRLDNPGATGFWCEPTSLKPGPPPQTQVPDYDGGTHYAPAGSTQGAGQGAAQPAGGLQSTVVPKIPGEAYTGQKAQQGGPLTEEVVKVLIKDNLAHDIDRNTTEAIFDFKSIKIGGAKPLDSIMQYLKEGIPPNVKTVYPVRSEFDYTVRSKRNPLDTTTVERVSYAYFYKNDFGDWTFSWYADPGQRNVLKKH